MKRAFVICGLLRPDMNPLLDEIKPEGEIHWLEAGLHARPDHLREVLQEKIDSIADCDQIALTYALCGNALLGLRATTADVAYLCTDDCISAVMCDHPCLAQLRSTSIFTSRSWLGSSMANPDDLGRIVEKYGEKRAATIIKAMYGHYTNTVYMQTEDEIAKEDLEAARAGSGRIGTNLVIEPAGLDAYRSLLKGEPHRLIRILEKGRTLEFADFHGLPDRA